MTKKTGSATRSRYTMEFKLEAVRLVEKEAKQCGCGQATGRRRSNLV